VTDATDEPEIFDREGVLARLATQCILDSQRWFPGHTHDIGYHVLALCGETGELANKVKKVIRGDRTMKEGHRDIAEELTDVFIYTMNLVALLNIDLVMEYRKKRVINEERFGPLNKLQEDIDKFGREGMR